MFTVIFSSDHEIHGNGDGAPLKLMIEPTERMMNLLSEYGAKLTIFADVAEILRFRSYCLTTGTDLFSYKALSRQLRDAVSRGHDVQLHIHSSYYKSFYNGSRWEQSYDEYDLTRLSKERLNQIIRDGKQFLEDLLQDSKTNYQCNVFRAANWSMMPSQTIVNALINNGFIIDSSIFKYGVRSGLVDFNYSTVPSALVPWPVSAENVCRKDSQSPLFEVPIYAEARYLWSFLTLNRLFRVLNSRNHPLPQVPPRPQNIITNTGEVSTTGRITSRHAMKMDFNQCNAMQLIKGLLRAEKKYGHLAPHLPFVLIGHSKLFTRHNQKTLLPFLQFVSSHPSRFKFGLYSDIDVEQFR